MEQLKVRKKDVIVTNAILYLGLSFIFLYLQYAYRHHLSPFSLEYLRKSAELFWYIALPLLISAILIWRHHRLALYSFDFCICLAGFKVVEGLFIEFNKFIVITLFFYSAISYFLHQLLGRYFSLSYLNANFSSSDLFGPLLRQIPCKVKVQNREVKGFLTNWDEEGCFLKLEEQLAPGPSVILELSFQGKNFTQEGEVVAHSLDLTRLGIKFENRPKELNVFNWDEFIELVHELGFLPERLR